MVCTANLCRSPMAGALLEHHLGALGVPATVRSAGLLGPGQCPPPEAVAAMASRGLDTSAHRSRRLSPEDLARADLVVAMAREHVREAVLMSASAWPRTFTLKELVRRGEEAGGRPPGQDLCEWLAKLHAGRSRTDLLGSSPLDDVADPIGGPPRYYEATAEELDDLTARLVRLAWSHAAPQGHEAHEPAARGQREGGPS